jgi:hypothetical protein
VEFLSRRHSNLGSGPPRGPGHYSEDGRRWWEDGHRRWFPVTDQEDELEIEVEDLGATSLSARLWTTLVTQYGTRYSGSWARPAARMYAGRPIGLSGRASRPPPWRTPAAKERGPQSNGPAWRSCTKNCSGSASPRDAAPGAVRVWTSRRSPVPSRRCRPPSRPSRHWSRERRRTGPQSSITRRWVDRSTRRCHRRRLGADGPRLRQRGRPARERPESAGALR